MILPRLHRGFAAFALIGLSVAALLAPRPLHGAIVRGTKPLSEYELPGLDQRVELQSYAEWDVAELIEFLALKGGLKNVVVGRGISGQTTKLTLDNVTVGEALEAVLAVNQLAYMIEGDILTIMTDAEYQDLYGTSFYDQKEVKVVNLQYADPVRVADMLASLKSTIGTIVADPVTGTLVLIDTPDKIEAMRVVIDAADIETISRQLPTATEPFTLQYAEVEEIQGEVAELLTQEAGSLRVDRRTRTLVVTDLPHNIPRIRQLVELFDRPPKQVFIESKLVQVSLSDDYRLGINWETLLTGIDPSFQLSAVAAPGSISSVGDAVNPTASVDYQTIVGRGDLQVVIDALRSVGDTRILSNPHVAVLDGKLATIKVVTDQPYAEAQLESGTTNVVGEQIQFLEVGVTLDVEPRINDNGFISMAVRPEVSSKIGDYQAFRNVPIIRRSYAETTVMIQDGETIIIAGMIEDQNDDNTRAVPLLGRIPILGTLFRTTQDRSLSNELVVFLTPRTITGAEPYLRMKDVPKPPKPLRSVGATDTRRVGASVM